MNGMRILCWIVTAVTVWLCLSVPFGSGVWAGAVLLLLVASRLASGNLLIFFLVTGWVALSNGDLTATSSLEALYLPLWVMLSGLYVLCFAVWIVPGLAARGSAPGSTGAGGDGGGGANGC
ncbi:hypothetical protein M0534_00245 [Methylonatrum kenyense]|uniref:hypothetical protein n=1 Tax=Methylonatrum kenyense TaxID=455253 RepID=UPI0020BE9E2C|nr:hypothetical protein [Methylonatrum kenyense]MCK8514762.1 hypothetical protein [Methylonatrum kenyense]